MSMLAVVLHQQVFLVFQRLVEEIAHHYDFHKRLSAAINPATCAVVPVCRGRKSKSRTVRRRTIASWTGAHLSATTQSAPAPVPRMSEASRHWPGPSSATTEPGPR